MPEASPFWQNAFLAGVFVLFGWAVWSGWRAGVVRAAAGLLGLVGGGFFGFAVGSALTPLIGFVVPLPRPFIALVLGLVIGVAIYLGTWFLAALLFKRTAQQRTGLLRFFYGLGGALLGAGIGVTLYWTALFGVRGFGGLLEGEFAVPAGARENFFTRAVVKLKRSIEAGPTGRQIVAGDIMPEWIYSLLEKLGEFTAAARVDPAVIDRFYQYPPVADLMTDPRIVAITSDPEAYDSMQDQNLGALLRNPKLIAALNDPALIAKAQKIELEKALDYALQKPAPTPAPSP